jgi:hypothetical protein
MTRPEMLKIQTAALRIMQPDFAKLTNSLVSSQVLGQHAFRLPPAYFDHLIKFPEVADLIKTLGLQVKIDFSQFASWSVNRSLFDSLDTFVSEHDLTAPVIEVGAAAILRTHPGLSRSAARLLFIAWAYLVVASCAYYAMITYPDLAPFGLGPVHTRCTWLHRQGHSRDQREAL